MMIWGAEWPIFCTVRIRTQDLIVLTERFPSFWIRTDWTVLFEHVSPHLAFVHCAHLASSYPIGKAQGTAFTHFTSPLRWRSLPDTLGSTRDLLTASSTPICRFIYIRHRFRWKHNKNNMFLLTIESKHSKGVLHCTADQTFSRGTNFDVHEIWSKVRVSFDKRIHMYYKAHTVSDASRIGTETRSVELIWDLHKRHNPYWARRSP